MKKAIGALFALTTVLAQAAPLHQLCVGDTSGADRFETDLNLTYDDAKPGPIDGRDAQVLIHSLRLYHVESDGRTTTVLDEKAPFTLKGSFYCGEGPICGFSSEHVGPESPVAYLQITLNGSAAVKSRDGKSYIADCKWTD